MRPLGPPESTSDTTGTYEFIGVKRLLCHIRDEDTIRRAASQCQIHDTNATQPPDTCLVTCDVGSASSPPRFRRSLRTARRSRCATLLADTLFRVGLTVSR